MPNPTETPTYEYGPAIPWRTNKDVTELAAKFKKIPTETPEEKEALDAIEQKSPYDVGAHCSGMDKPVFTQAMADAGELPPVGSRVGRSGWRSKTYEWVLSIFIVCASAHFDSVIAVIILKQS